MLGTAAQELLPRPTDPKGFGPLLRGPVIEARCDILWSLTSLMISQHFDLRRIYVYLDTEWRIRLIIKVTSFFPPATVN